jgi:hypothetical protein
MGGGGDAAVIGERLDTPAQTLSPRGTNKKPRLINDSRPQVLARFVLLSSASSPQPRPSVLPLSSQSQTTEVSGAGSGAIGGRPRTGTATLAAAFFRSRRRRLAVSRDPVYDMHSTVSTVRYT